MGISKFSRVTKNLPNRAKNLSESGCLEIFAAAIFYIGKGTRTRPYAHFKEAITKKAVSCQVFFVSMHAIDIRLTTNRLGGHAELIYFTSSQDIIKNPNKNSRLPGIQIA